MSEWLDIHAYADGELDEGQRAEVQDRICSCERSQSEYRAVVEVKQVLGERAGALQCEETWARCCRRLDELDKAKKIEGFVGRYAWGLCSVFLVMILAAGLFNRSSTEGFIRTGDVPQMASSLLPAVPVNGSARPEEVQQILSGHVNQAPTVTFPHSMRIGSIAAGVQQSRQIMRFTMEDARGPLTLFIVSGTLQPVDVEQMADGGRFYAGQIDRMNCVAWSESGYVLFLASDRSHDQIRQEAEHISIY
jgi:anti-sigma factor RsiW